MKANVIRQEWSAEELGVRLEEERQRLFNLLVQRQAQELENTEEVKRAARDIARILTVATERKLQGQTELSAQELGDRIAELKAQLVEVMALANDRSSRVTKGRVKALKRELGRLKGLLKAKQA